jgi:predicted phage gp36 major capsid-like protein
LLTSNPQTTTNGSTVYTVRSTTTAGTDIYTPAVTSGSSPTLAGTNTTCTISVQ